MKKTELPSCKGGSFLRQVRKSKCIQCQAGIGPIYFLCVSLLCSCEDCLVGGLFCLCAEEDGCRQQDTHPFMDSSHAQCISVLSTPQFAAAVKELGLMLNLTPKQTAMTCCDPPCPALPTSYPFLALHFLPFSKPLDGCIPCCFPSLFFPLSELYLSTQDALRTGPYHKEKSL